MKKVCDEEVDFSDEVWVIDCRFIELKYSFFNINGTGGSFND